LREQMEKLVALQTVDLKIQEMERVKGEIPQRIATLEEEFRKEEEKVQSERAGMEKLQKERRQKEKDLEEEIDRVKKSEARVFEIKTNKEYQAVQKEIENAKKLNREREEEILEILEHIEEGQKRLSKGEKSLEVRRKEYRLQIAELQQKEASFAQEMAEEVRQREEREKELPESLLSRYRMLLEKRQGVAVARVINGVCQACNMNLRPQLYIELQKQDTLIVCPNCNRILFWENGSMKAKET
jgi:predicted  nucleic acid-binding Zn-ribbon protein